MREATANWLRRFRLSFFHSRPVDVHHGRVGNTTEGRYGIVSAGEASVEFEDLTSGAGTTLGLSGF